jgi:hypothetical protein
MRFPKSGLAKEIRAASCFPSYQGSAGLLIQPGGSDLSLKAKSKNKRFKLSQAVQMVQNSYEWDANIPKELRNLGPWPHVQK